MYEFLIVLLLLCIYRFDVKQDTYHKNFFYAFICIVMTLMGGLGYKLGIDPVTSYEPQYEYWPKLKDITWRTLLYDYPGYQSGWILFWSLCKSISPSWYFMKIVHSIFVNVTVFWVVKRKTPWMFSSILFYLVLVYPNYNFGMMRQVLACACAMFAFEQMHKKKWLGGILWILGGYMFHSSALILLISPLFFLVSDMRGRRRTWLFIGLYLFMIIFSEVIIRLMPNLMTASMTERFTTYQTDRVRDFRLITVLSFIFNAFIPIVTVVLVERKGGTIKYVPELYILSAFLVLNLFVPIFYRLVEYLSVYRYMIMVELFYFLGSYVRERSFRIAATHIVMYGYLVFWGLHNYSGYVNETFNVRSYDVYYPYHSVLTKKTTPEREIVLSYVAPY